MSELFKSNTFTWTHYPYPLTLSDNISPPSINAAVLNAIKNRESVTIPVFHFDRYYDPSNKKMSLIKEFSATNMLRLQSMYRDKVPNIYHIGSSGYYMYPYISSPLKLKLRSDKYVRASNKIRLLVKLYSRFMVSHMEYNQDDADRIAFEHVDNIFNLQGKGIYADKLDTELVLRYCIRLMDNTYFSIPTVESYEKMRNQYQDIGLPPTLVHRGKSIVPLTTMIKSLLRMIDYQVDKISVTSDVFNSSDYIWIAPFQLYPIPKTWRNGDTYEINFDQRFIDIRINMLGKLLDLDAVILTNEPQFDNMKPSNYRGVEIIIPSVNLLESLDKLKGLKDIHAGDPVSHDDHVNLRNYLVAELYRLK